VTPERTVTEIEGRRITVSNLDKVLFPEAHFTKGDMISYYVHCAPFMLPHLRDRPVTLKRFPDGVEGESFFEKNVPRGAPDWVQTVAVPRSADGARATGKGGSGRRRSSGRQGDIVYPVLNDVPSLAWAANLAAVELHVPMWRASGAGGFGPVDLMVFDLDPGAPATIVECCTVGRWLAAELAPLELEAHPKTSGSKGLQLYVPVDPPQPWEQVREQARQIAAQVEAAHPETVIVKMGRDLRRGKVLIDWSQNHPAKTTVAPYSLRARPSPTVSMPVSWEEVHACEEAADPSRLVFSPADALDRVQRLGDLWGPLLG
jgi:bifunctional non-homologous end joining protein LigD